MYEVEIVTIPIVNALERVPLAWRDKMAITEETTFKDLHDLCKLGLMEMNNLGWVGAEGDLSNSGMVVGYFEFTHGELLRLQREVIKFCHAGKLHLPDFFITGNNGAFRIHRFGIPFYFVNQDNVKFSVPAVDLINKRR